MKELLFEGKHIVKKFGPTVALNDVDLKIYRGEIRGFIGENGSGKSTMSAIMTGIHKLTSGEMYFKGKEWKPKSMIDALNNGIGICIQEAGTVPRISVAENIYLGELDRFSGDHYFTHIQNLAIYFSKEFNFDLNPIKNKLKEILDKQEEIRKINEYRYLDNLKRIKELKEEIKLAKKDSSIDKTKLVQDINILKEDNKQILVKVKEDQAKIKANILEANNMISSFLGHDFLIIKKAYLTKKEEIASEYKIKTKELNDKFIIDKKFIEDKFNKEKEENLRDPYLIDLDIKDFTKKLHAEYIIDLNKETNKVNKFNSDMKIDLRMVKASLNQILFFIKNGLRYEEHTSQIIKKKIIDFVFKPFVNKKKLYENATIALKKSGLDFIDPKEKIGSYNMQQRKLVEMAKVINKDPEIFIVDETTNALTEDGRNLIYSKMNEFKKENKAVLFISHDLDEIMRVCDVLTILRDGNIVAEISKEDFEPEIIKRHMIGRQLDNHFYREDFDSSCSDEIALKLENAYTKNLKDINIELHRGEILGIGGLSDCGMHEVGKIMFGATHMIDGEVKTGKNLEILVTSERVAMKNNIGYVSKDRDYEALSLTDSIHTNIAIGAIDKIKRANFVVLKKDEKKIVDKEIADLRIKCQGREQVVSALSGGNKQKVSLAKWLGNGSDILILDCPTRGVDIGVKQFIYDLLYQMKKEGKAILMISEELPELIGMSDRILIMKDGQITKEFKRSASLTQEEIVDYMI